MTLSLGMFGMLDGGMTNIAFVPLLSCFVVALTHSTKVFTKRHHPSVHSRRIVHEAFIAADGFAGDGVNHGHGVAF